MAKLTQKQLISSLKQMKEIKPRREWAVLLKSQILAEKREEIKVVSQQATFTAIVSNIFSAKKLAYSFATILFLFVSALGFSKYAVPGDMLFPVKKITEQSVATLSGQTKLNQDITALDNRISELAQVAKEDRSASIPSAISEITEAAKVLKDNSVKDPQTIKAIATSLRTLADVPGTDLSETSGVKDLYQTVVEAQIADLEKATLNDEQGVALVKAKSLYEQGKYSAALEEILSINQ